MTINRKFALGLLLIFVISMWEHIATESEFVYKPTYFLDQITKTIRPWFRYFGSMFAIAASFMENIKLFVENILKWMRIENYFRALARLFDSSYHLAVSWVWFIFGYLDYIKPLTEFSLNITIFGTVVIVGLLGFLFYKYVWFSPRFVSVKTFFGHIACVLVACAIVVSSLLQLSTHDKHL